MAVTYLAKVGDKNVRRVVKLTRTDNFTVAHRFERRRHRPSNPESLALALALALALTLTPILTPTLTPTPTLTLTLTLTLAPTQTPSLTPSLALTRRDGSQRSRAWAHSCSRRAAAPLHEP